MSRSSSASISTRHDAKNSRASVAIEVFTTEVTEESRRLRGIVVVALIFRFEGTDGGAALTVARQNLYAALGFVQTLLARARQFHALLEQLQTFFQRQIAALELAHDPFQIFQRRLEILWFAIFHFLVA